ncbi:hypothetical protein SSX86_005743 [Deinandra increscens subsp. villosa]|uniref:Association with the SNF1 complex (ASC) domain-containing protein n=1 Tax=Deinandra increscens subsp. villosa TaxID=3103831 RepID=A0AAP0DMF7_9ASTR
MQSSHHKILARNCPNCPHCCNKCHLNQPSSSKNFQRALHKPLSANLNHLYVKRDGNSQPVVALSSSQRFRNKFVTSVLYKPFKKGYLRLGWGEPVRVDETKKLEPIIGVEVGTRHFLGMAHYFYRGLEDASPRKRGPKNRSPWLGSSLLIWSSLF